MAKKTLTKEELVNVGYDLGVHILQAEQDMESTKRKFIMGVVSAYRMPEQVDSILVGYRQFYIEQGTQRGLELKSATRAADVRKAELNAIFKAVGKTEVSEDNLKKLESFEGTYHAWLTFARELSGKQPRKSPNSTPRTKTELTKVQQAKVHEMIGDASNDQLVAVAKDSVKNIIAHTPKPKGKEDKESIEKATMAGKNTLMLIRAAATSLVESDKFDELIRNTAKQVVELVKPVIEQLEANEQKAQEVIQMAQGEAVAA